MFVKELSFSKILGLLTVILLKKTPLQVCFQEFDHRFQNTYFTECFLMAASKIHKFLTSFMKSVLQIIVYVEIDIYFSTRMYFPTAYRVYVKIVINYKI